MGMAVVKLRPGVDTEQTATLNEAGYVKAEFIRWREGLVQKLGGWQRFYPFVLSGVPRALHAWQDFNGVSRLAVGTSASLSVITSSAFSDITPQTLTTNPVVGFTTAVGSPIVTVTDAGIANVTAFDGIYLNTPVAVGGLILSGLYDIIGPTSTTTYQIQAAANATSAVTAGGAVPSFTTVLASATVSVTLAAHGLAVGNVIDFPINTVVGGVTISGAYPVVSVTSASVFTIAANTQATAAATVAMNTAKAQINYIIALGPAASSAGWGTNAYGSGAWGVGTVSAAQTGTSITSSDWSATNWGDTLIACPEGGGIYAWSPAGGMTTATLIPNAPEFNSGVFVSQPAQILVAWGSTARYTIGTAQDPLLIRWSDQLDYTQWTASTTTQAGSYRISTGSMIVAGMQASQTSMIWTDLDVYDMKYVGFPLVFGFNKVGSNCGLIGKHAVTQWGGQVFWMGRANFYTMSGDGARPIPCPVWDAVFQDLDGANSRKCVAWTNSLFNEIWFFYPSLSGGTGECDKCVKLNLMEGSWDALPLSRSAAIDKSVLAGPIAATPGGLIYEHEVGYDADGDVLHPRFTTGYFDVSSGHEIAFLDYIIPDMIWGPYNQNQNATLSITLFSQMFPGDTPRVYGPFQISKTQQFISPRVRGRQIAMQVESSDIGSFWRLGKIRYRVAVDGRQ